MGLFDAITFLLTKLENNRLRRGDPHILFFSSQICEFNISETEKT